MKTMTRALIVLTALGLAASLGAQSLVELAKREKERREALKGKSAVVVRNHDLFKVKKAPALEIVKAAEGTAGLAAEDLTAETMTAQGEPEASVAPSGSAAPASRRITPRVAAPGPTLMGEDTASPSGQATASSAATTTQALEAQLRAAEEQVDLLQTKMAALRQQYEYQDAMVPGYVIQKQMDETNQRLLKAQAQVVRIRSELEKKGKEIKKDPGAIDR